jgi:hypothetical protein
MIGGMLLGSESVRPRTHARGGRRALGILLLLCIAPLNPLFAQKELEGGWLRFALVGRSHAVGWGASSVLESASPLLPSRYGPEKALDGDPATSWVEGAAGPGRGELLVLSLPACPEALGFQNGYAKNRTLFLKNHRLKKAVVRLYAAVNVSGFATERATLYDARPVSGPAGIVLDDRMAPQRVALPYDLRELHRRWEAFRNSEAIAKRAFPQAREMGLAAGEGPPLSFRWIITIEIAEVYRGSRWEDTCIAELWPDYGEVAGVSLSEDERRLLIRKETGGRIPVYAEFDALLTLVTSSDDSEWAVLLREPAYAEAGERVTGEYAVVHTPTGRDVSALIFAEPSLLGGELLPTAFTTKGGNVYLQYERLDGSGGGRVPCRLY